MITLSHTLMYKLELSRILDTPHSDGTDEQVVELSGITSQTDRLKKKRLQLCNNLYHQILKHNRHNIEDIRFWKQNRTGVQT